jgi:hypothetical protein
MTCLIGDDDDDEDAEASLADRASDSCDARYERPEQGKPESRISYDEA